MTGINSIGFKQKDFEYDVHSLVKAFFPENDIYMFYTGEGTHPDNAEFALNVDLRSDEISLHAAHGGKTYDSIKNIPKDTDRKTVKNILKQCLYQMLSGVTKKTLPWGTLTGIRPVKIPLQLMEQGMKNSDIANYMRETYFTSGKKVSLAIATAAREKDILESIDTRNGYSLYVGIPFCPSVCLYCSFGSHPYEKWSHLTDEYLRVLYKELDYISQAMQGRALQTIYIGGGTPTTLHENDLDSLLEHIDKRFDTGNLTEYTVEAGRPDTVTSENMKILRMHGVSRVSINPQTMNDPTLRLIGRNHTAAQTAAAFETARDAGFTNINMDIIVGLPREGLAEVTHTLNEIKKLNPDSLTVHSLALKRAARLNLFKEEYTAVSFDNSQEIMDLAHHAAMEMDMQPYYLYRQKNMGGNLENIGYAKEGCFGIYNVLIMEEKQSIAAAGSGAVSKFVFDDGRIERAGNVKDIKNYIERIDEMLVRKEKYLKCN